MKHFTTLSAVFGLASRALAASSFAGSNLYYAAGLDGDQQTTLLQGLSDSGVKVIRVWLDGENSPQKNTYFTSYPSLEGDSPGQFDDTVLDKLDDFMAVAHGYGIKVQISPHSYNALSGNNDFYGKYYGTGDFYSDPQAIQYYKNRLSHIMSHVNPHNGKTWAQSSEYIFGFETQNEAMHDVTPGSDGATTLENWQCEIAGAIKSNLAGSDILVMTGGASYVDNSLLSGYFSCDNLDVLSIHAYGDGDLTQSKLSPYVSKAQDAGKKLLMQEWGACYFNTENNDCPKGDALPKDTRDSNIERYAGAISDSGIPWFYWQVIPNEDGHDGYDYEIGVNGVNYDTFKSVAQGTSGYSTSFDFSKWLL